MNRRQFFSIAGGCVIAAGAGYYLASDTYNYTRSNELNSAKDGPSLHPDERAILYLASLAPSGHNTQPWFVRRIEPFYWIISNDKSSWLPSHRIICTRLPYLTCFTTSTFKFNTYRYA